MFNLLLVTAYFAMNYSEVTSGHLKTVAAYLLSLFCIIHSFVSYSDAKYKRFISRTKI